MEIQRCAGCPLGERPICKRDRGEEQGDSPLIAFVGSSPRSYEIKAGLAFSGEGPKVLRTILSSLQVDIGRCYFTHALRCQTPLGRKAKIDEVRACAPDLHERILAMKPRIIVAMGDDAVRSFIETTRAAGTVRGHVSSWHDYPVMPTIDPHSVVRVNPRYAPSDEKHDATGSPDAFPGLYRDVERAVAFALHDEPLVQQIPYDDYLLIRDEDGLDRLIRRLGTLRRGTPIAVDVETSGLNHREGHILTIALCWKPGTGVGLDWSWLEPHHLSALNEALRDHRLIYHNGAFDVPWMRMHGLPDASWSGDTMLMHYLVDERQGVHGLERLAIDRLSWPPYETALKREFKVGSEAANDAEASYQNVETEALLRYNVADVDATRQLWTILSAEAEEESVRQLHDDLLIPAAEHFLRLESDGMLVDEDYLVKIGATWREEMEALEHEMRQDPRAAEINLNSTKQIATYLYDVLGLEQMPSKDADEFVNPDLVLQLTDGVEDAEAQEYFRVAASTAFMKLKPRSTSTYMLWWLADQHPWPKALVQYRTVGTRYRTYYEGIRDRLDEHSRIRPRFRLHGTRTGRLSSTDPNIHGIARNKVVKDIFIADPGYTLIAADYSQAEVRMMAHYARDDTLIQALQESDIHRAISRRLFSVTEEDLQGMSDERVKFFRRAAKTIIFGLIYGRTPASLAPQLGVSLAETNDYIASLYRMMPKVPEFIRQQQQRVLREQEAVSIYGRKRRFPLVLRANASQIRRQGVNMPIQSSVSDMTLKANLEILRRLDDDGVPTLVWPHIHDGFLFQAPDEHADHAVEVTKDVMLRPTFRTNVHFAVEIEVGKRWGQLTEVFSG